MLLVIRYFVQVLYLPILFLTFGGSGYQVVFKELRGPFRRFSDMLTASLMQGPEDMVLLRPLSVRNYPGLTSNI